MIISMVTQAIRRGFSDTWRFARTRIVTSVSYIVGVFILASAVRYFFFGREMMLGEWEVAFSGLLGVLLFLLVALFWNITCAPFKIERDRRVEVEAQLSGVVVASHQVIKPDWSMRDLLYHVDPFVMRDDRSGELDPLRNAERKIIDQASLGNLRVWGRQFDEQGLDKMMGISRALEPIKKERWAEFYLNHTAFFNEDDDVDAHVSPIDKLSGPLYTDLRVSSAEAKQLWPDLGSESEIRFEALVSVVGVQKLRKSSFRSIEQISYEGRLPSKNLDVRFSRPMPRRYSVRAESNGTISLSVLADAPDKCRLRLQASDWQSYPVAIMFNLLGQEWYGD